MQVMRYLFVIILVVNFSSCSNSSKQTNEQESKADEPQLESCVDYSTVNQEDPRSYWDIFVADVLCTKGFPDYGELNTVVNIFFIEQTEAQFISGTSPDHAGYSTYLGYCNEDIIDIRVVKQYWDDYSEAQKLWLMYHEFGHDVFRYNHTEASSSEIMWPSVLPRNGTMNDFIRAKNNFINRKFSGITYIPCNNG